MIGPSGQRRRLERDLHDGVQNELVSLLLRLSLAEEDRTIPPTVAATLAAMADHVVTALDALREITHGIYPQSLATFGVREALRVRAARAAVDVTILGSAPRSSKEAEEAVYFACSEAIQNAAKHAGREARITLRLHHRQGSLSVHIADDGQSFDPAHTHRGAGLEHINDRIAELGGNTEMRPSPGHGTAVLISLSWPPRTDRQQ